MNQVIIDDAVNHVCPGCEKVWNVGLYEYSPDREWDKSLGYFIHE